jgi:hypothetical protein
MQDFFQHQHFDDRRVDRLLATDDKAGVRIVPRIVRRSGRHYTVDELNAVLNTYVRVEILGPTGPVHKNPMGGILVSVSLRPAQGVYATLRFFKQSSKGSSTSEVFMNFEDQSILVVSKPLRARGRLSGRARRARPAGAAHRTVLTVSLCLQLTW